MLAWTVVTSLAALFYILPLTVLMSLIMGLLGYWRTSACIVAALVVLGSLPLREWPAARKFFQILYEPFGVKHVLTPERAKIWVEASKLHGERYILGMHPHGVFPIQALMWAAYADQYLATPELGTLYGFGGMASVILYLPVLRTIMGWLTGMPATYANLKRNLTSGTGGTFHNARHPGRNLYMLPGGLAEIFTAEPRKHVVIWRARRGLCRLALETGARLVPVYVFGGNDFYQQALTSDAWLARLSRKAGISVTLFWGRFWWLPPVPLVPPHGVTIALPSEPLPSRRAASADGKATEEEVSKLNAEYEAALRTLFEEYKGVCGYPEGELVVK